MAQFPISIDRVVDLLGLERDPRRNKGDSYFVKCPFCRDQKFHMNINTVKNAYNCFTCGGSHTGGGTLDLYGRVALGVELIPGKEENGGNGRMLYEKLTEALGMSSGVSPVQAVKAASPQKETVRNVRTFDIGLHRAYSAIFGWKWFELTEEHKKNLRKRGLDDAAIERNGYRSIPPDCGWVKQFPEEQAAYWDLGLDKAAMEHTRLKHQTKDQRIAGFIVAKHLEKQGISMAGVPGFYRLNDQWMFRLEPGMLIPTRNRKGQIVGVQARKDTGKVRYMTISSKSLPNGVSEGISRIHFPLSNAPLTKDAKVFLTEGPLKADVTACLMQDPKVFLVAIQGVNNTKELPEFFETARKAGVTVLYNCLDMDKTTNPTVAAASRVLRQMAESYGIAMRMRTWDVTFAEAKWLELYGLCRYHHLQIPHEYPVNSDSVFVDVGKMAAQLHEHGVKHSQYLTKTGMVKRYWSDATKGIDDFLLAEQEKK